MADAEHAGWERRKGDQAPAIRPVQGVARNARSDVSTALLSLQAQAGNASVTRMLATREFKLGSQHHTLALRPGLGGLELILASTPEDVVAKLKRFDVTVRNYIAGVGTDEAVKAFLERLQKLREAVSSRFAELDLETPASFYRKVESTPEVPVDSGWTAVRRPQKPRLDRARVEEDVRRLDEAMGTIRKIADDLAKFAADEGVEGFEVEDVELWQHREFMRTVVYPKQDAVAEVIRPCVALIAAILPGAQVGFRGSLARGLKSFRKVAADGAVRRFDPAHFDADAFIEIPNKTWEDIRGWAGDDLGGKALLADLASLANTKTATGDPIRVKLRELLTIEQTVRVGLAKVTGYETSPGANKHAARVADFHFMLQPVATSRTQKAVGNPYQTGALAKAGMPVVESKLPRTVQHREIGGAAVSTGEAHVMISEDGLRTLRSRDFRV